MDGVAYGVTDVCDQYAFGWRSCRTMHTHDVSYAQRCAFLCWLSLDDIDRRFRKVCCSCCRVCSQSDQEILKSLCPCVVLFVFRLHAVGLKCTESIESTLFKCTQLALTCVCVFVCSCAFYVLLSVRSAMFLCPPFTQSPPSPGGHARGHYAALAGRHRCCCG